MDYYTSLRVFDAAARVGSFAGAGRALGLSRDQVSKLVVALERRVAQRLFDRSTRAVTLTPAGALYLERVRRGLAELAEADAAILTSDTRPDGLLTVHAPLSWGLSVLSPLCGAFRAAFPQVRVDLTLDDRAAESLPTDADVVIRIAGKLEATASVVQLSPVHRGLFASMRYLDEYPAPDTPEALKEHQCVHYAPLSSGEDWVLTTGSEIRRVRVNGGFSCNAGLAVRDAIVAGHGIGILPDFLASGPLAAGELVRVLDRWSPPQLHVHAVTQPAMRQAPKIRAFIDFVASHVATEHRGASAPAQ